jgi:DNA-binding NarL/FixJ family response regulator
MSAPTCDRLSDRDRHLLVLLARGHTTDRAARELRLSRHTVGEEISALLGRFRCRNRAELVAYCYVHRLLPVGVWPPPFHLPDPETAGDRA